MIEAGDVSKSFIDPILDHIVNTLEDYWDVVPFVANHTRSLRFLLSQKQLCDQLKTKQWASVNWTPLYRLVSKLLLKSFKNEVDFSASHVQDLCKIYGILLTASSELEIICDQALDLIVKILPAAVGTPSLETILSILNLLLLDCLPDSFRYL